MKVLLGLVVVGCFLPLQVQAQANTISSFVSCLNGLPSGATVIDAAKTCVPDSGCYFTNTLSQESAQPACTLRDGTRLPRVIYSCTGRGGSQTLRLRPSFTLCTTDNLINHIEVGEDNRPNDTDDPGFVGFNIQYMADVDMTQARPFTLFLQPGELSARAVVDAPGNSKGCRECHDAKGTAPTPSGTFNLFAPVPPEVAEGTIGTNDPTVAPPANTVPLSVICSDIANSSQLHKNPTKQAFVLSLCTALLGKEH